MKENHPVLFKFSFVDDGKPINKSSFIWNFLCEGKAFIWPLIFTLVIESCIIIFKIENEWGFWFLFSICIFLNIFIMAILIRVWLVGISFKEAILPSKIFDDQKYFSTSSEIGFRSVPFPKIILTLIFISCFLAVLSVALFCFAVTKVLWRFNLNYNLKLSINISNFFIQAILYGEIFKGIISNSINNFSKLKNEINYIDRKNIYYKDFFKDFEISTCPIRIYKNNQNINFNSFFISQDLVYGFPNFLWDLFKNYSALWDEFINFKIEFSQIQDKKYKKSKNIMLNKYKIIFANLLFCKLEEFTNLTNQSFN